MTWTRLGWGLAFGVGCVAAFLVGMAAAVALGGSVNDYGDNALATVVGVGIGVPIAVYLGNEQERRAGRAEKAARATERKELLELLQTDLHEVNAELVADDRRDRHAAIIPFLRTDVWRVISDSGQLRLIDDVGLLRNVARAYHRIGLTAFLEEEAWTLVHAPGWVDLAHRAERDQNILAVLQTTKDQDEHTLAAITVALGGIATALAVP
jgi:hypothetical protein